MTDAEYLFKQDIREKKTTGYGAKHKKASVKGPKGCRMPSDNLTKKEKEAMNGEIVSWSPKAFYTWEEFKAFPDRIQKEYLLAICKRYSCGVRTAMRGIFGDIVAHNSTRYMAEHGMKRDDFPPAARGRAASKTLEAIREDKDRSKQQIDEADISEEVPVVNENDNYGTGLVEPEQNEVQCADSKSIVQIVREKSVQKREPFGISYQTDFDGSVAVPDIYTDRIEFACTVDRLKDLSLIAALFGGTGKVSVEIRKI